MKKNCIILMIMATMALNSNLVAQSIGSLNEYGETIDEFGGIVAPPLGDTVKFKRVAGTAIYSLNGSTKISNPQKGSALMVICNDSVYYWKSPISLMPESPYWIKGLCDKQAQTVTFEQGQVNYLQSDNTVSTLGWCVRDPQASTKYQVALDHADAFVFDIKGDTLTLRDSQKFSSSTKGSAYFMGAHKGSSFIKYGDGATQLVRQYPVAERDTVEITAVRLYHFYEGKNGDGYTGFASNNDELEQIQFALSGDRGMGTYATTGIYYRNTMIEHDGGWIDFYDGEVNIFEDNEGFKLQGVLIGMDEKAYVLNLIQPAGTYDYDAFKDLDLTISMDSVRIEIEEPGHIDLLVSMRDYEVNLELFTDPSNTVPPVGDYVISDTRLPGTALKSEGYFDGLVYSCSVVALMYNSDGSVFTNNLWLFVSGTVSVNADGSMLAVGKNSYGRDIRVSYTPSTATGLQQSAILRPQSPIKVLQKGQFIIRKGNKHFNALGQEVR